MFNKVLLPVDVNHPESWEKALPAALHCAGPDGEIHVLGVVLDLGAAVISSFLPQDFVQHAMEDLKGKLAELAKTEISGDVRVEVHVAHGHVPETILRVADTLAADLIVMVSHPPNDLQTVLVGSAAGKVVRHATIPVLTVR